MKSETRLAILERRLAVHIGRRRLRVVILDGDEPTPAAGPDEHLIVILPAERYLKLKPPAFAREARPADPPAEESEDVPEDDLENATLSELEARLADLERELAGKKVEHH